MPGSTDREAFRSVREARRHGSRGFLLRSRGSITRIARLFASVARFGRADREAFRAIREALAAAVRGSSPIVALEYGRRAIPLAFRPSFLEMEQKLKGG